MRVTKFGHACVLVEAQDRVALFDPGKWSEYSLEDLPSVDEIVYTHEHGDHFDVEKLKQLLVWFPDAHVLCGSDIREIVESEGIKVPIVPETRSTVKFSSRHEELPIPGVDGPAQNGYHFEDMFTHPGDGQSFSETKKVLAMGFGWPWGSFRAGLEKVIELKPSYVLPIHDWHFSKEGREWNLGLISDVLEKEGIIVLDSTPGIVHNIE